jgi:hypothetical protein
MILQRSAERLNLPIAAIRRTTGNGARGWIVLKNAVADAGRVLG